MWLVKSSRLLPLDRGPVNPNSYTLILSEPHHLLYHFATVAPLLDPMTQPCNSHIIRSPIKSTCHQLSTLLRPILIYPDHCRLGTPQKSCSFEDVLCQLSWYQCLVLIKLAHILKQLWPIPVREGRGGAGFCVQAGRHRCLFVCLLRGRTENLVQLSRTGLGHLSPKVGLVFLLLTHPLIYL